MNDSLKCKEVVIVGGSGFIGSRLFNRLSNNSKFNPKIIDKAPSNQYPNYVINANITSLDQISSAITDNSIIINLAAEHRDDVSPQSLYSDVNIGGAVNICTVAREKNIQTIIFTSTVAVYGFAPVGTGESGAIAPFNEYGRTKFEAEKIFKIWQAEAPDLRSLVIIRPTVVFGEKNRGNVFNLLRQIASGFFLMIGNGENRKSIAYVENVAAFIEYSLTFGPGVHTFNYVDKPDFTMKELVANVRQTLGIENSKFNFHVPFPLGFFLGKCFDFIALITGKKFPISSIRVKKFCANSVYSTAVNGTGFIPPIALDKALEKTLQYEFIERHDHEHLFFSE